MEAKERTRNVRLGFTARALCSGGAVRVRAGAKRLEQSDNVRHARVHAAQHVHELNDAADEQRLHVGGVARGGGSSGISATAAGRRRAPGE